MTTVLNDPTLVLNKGWKPVSVAPVRHAFCMLFGRDEHGKRGPKAQFIDTDTFVVHGFDTWRELEVKPQHRVIQTSNGVMRAPEVLVLRHYNKYPTGRSVKLTRRNLLIRDKFRCQYTGERLNSRTATIDHIIPRSHGGKTTWDNVVIASVSANTKKGDRTPKEAGMTLLNTNPCKPAWNPIYSRVVKVITNNNYPLSWKKFIDWDPESYWDVELEE